MSLGTRHPARPRTFSAQAHDTQQFGLHERSGFLKYGGAKKNRGSFPASRARKTNVPSPVRPPALLPDDGMIGSSFWGGFFRRGSGSFARVTPPFLCALKCFQRCSNRCFYIPGMRYQSIRNGVVSYAAPKTTVKSHFIREVHSRFTSW